MNDNNANSNSIKALLVIDKVEIPLFCILLGLMVILSYFKLLNLVRAFFALFVFFTAVHLLVFQKRVTAPTILLLITGCLFLSSSFLSAYLVTMPFPTILFLNQIGIGISTVASGLMIIAFVTAILNLYRSYLPSKFKFPWPVGLMFLVLYTCGIVLVWVGVFSVISGIGYL